MSLVAEMRARAGLTQAEFAKRAGTSRSRLSAYEHERTAPELDTLERLAGAAGVELAVAPRGTRRVNAQIDALQGAVAEGRFFDGVRLTAELMAWARHDVIDIEALRHEPAGTGDRRWDALVAGVAEILFTERGRRVPGWASSPGRILDHPWFVSTLRSLWPEILVTTPAALAARGVLISARSLDSV